MGGALEHMRVGPDRYLCEVTGLYVFKVLFLYAFLAVLPGLGKIFGRYVPSLGPVLVNRKHRPYFGGTVEHHLGDELVLLGEIIVHRPRVLVRHMRVTEHYPLYVAVSIVSDRAVTVNYSLQKTGHFGIIGTLVLYKAYPSVLFGQEIPFRVPVRVRRIEDAFVPHDLEAVVIIVLVVYLLDLAVLHLFFVNGLSVTFPVDLDHVVAQTVGMTVYIRFHQKSIDYLAFLIFHLFHRNGTYLDSTHEALQSEPVGIFRHTEYLLRIYRIAPVNQHLSPLYVPGVFGRQAVMYLDPRERDQVLVVLVFHGNGLAYFAEVAVHDRRCYHYHFAFRDLACKQAFRKRERTRHFNVFKLVFLEKLAYLRRKVRVFEYVRKRLVGPSCHRVQGTHELAKTYEVLDLLLAFTQLKIPEGPVLLEEVARKAAEVLDDSFIIDVYLVLLENDSQVAAVYHHVLAHQAVHLFDPGNILQELSDAVLCHERLVGNIQKIVELLLVLEILAIEPDPFFRGFD